MVLITTLIFSFFTAIFSSAQAPLHQLDLLAIGPNENAAEATLDWDKLIGEWDIKMERVGPSGAVVSSRPGSWNIFYVLDGYVIQDAFKLDQTGGEPFQFVGLRIFDEAAKRWKQVTIDNYEKRLEFAEGTSNQDKVMLNYTHQSGAELRSTYYNISKDGFEWKQEKLDKHTGTWNMGMRVIATRKR